MSNGSDAQLGTWLAVGVLIGAALALLLGVLALAVHRARRTRRAVGAQSREPATPTPPEAGPEPSAQGFLVDDLPGFAERPPGWTPRPGAASSAAAAGGAGAAAPDAKPGEVPAGEVGHQAGARRAETRPDQGSSGLGRAGTTAVAAAVGLLVAAIVVAYLGGGPGASVASARSGTATVAPVPSGAPDPTATSAPAAQPGPTSPVTATAAAASALESVPLGEDGIAASVTFEGVVLEQRAVGLTVTYPSVSVTTDGSRSLAHVRFPTFNCLTAEPPPDPLAAGCARSLTEYADLAGPQLQVSPNGDGIELVGLFPTYTRPNGSAPHYTGRAYQLAATITAAGPERDGAAPASGVVRIGLDSAPTTADRGVNLLQSPG